MKLVTCLHGSVWDVAVDLRAGSPTYLSWHAVELSSLNFRAVLIPEGFAHGFQSLCDDCEMIYLHSMAYALESEVGIDPRETSLSINWPLAITELSVKDSQHNSLGPEFEGVKL